MCVASCDRTSTASATCAKASYIEAGKLNTSDHAPPVGPSAGQNAEGRLEQWIDMGISVQTTTLHFEPTVAGDDAAANTATELGHLHNGERMDSRLLREYIRGRWIQLLEKWSQVSSTRGAAQQKRIAELRAMLSKRSLYAAVLRNRMSDQITDANLASALGL